MVDLKIELNDVKLQTEGKFVEPLSGQVVNINDWDIENKPYFEDKPDLSDSEYFHEELSRSVLRRSLPRRVIWDEFQTPVENQRNRNTCSGFAMVAAIEARYRRDYDLTLDLSEQFFWHSYKSSSLSYPRRYHYENQSSFWGGGNSHGIRHAANFAICVEHDLSYLNRSAMNAIRDAIPEAGELQYRGDPLENNVTQEEVDAFEYHPSYIPQLARDRARYGVSGYVLLSGAQSRDTQHLARVIASGHEVIIDVKLDWKFVPEPTLDTALQVFGSGIWAHDSNKTNGGFHVFVLVGYDFDREVFIVKNSWGSPMSMISFDFVRAKANGASYITSVDNPDRPDLKGKYMGRWHMNHDGWAGDLLIRRFTGENNARIRLGHYRKHSDNSIHAVNGFVRNDERTLVFTIEDGADASPEDHQGQEFEVHLWSRHARVAAGITHYRNIPFGVTISRSPITEPVTRDFKAQMWIGSWRMNHDGWQGILVIESLDSRHGVHGYYTNASGVRKSLGGRLDNNKLHIANIYIQFGTQRPQGFMLCLHNWQSDRFSGVTHWSGRPFGAIGTRI